jgi:hypothetical protein
MLFLLSAEFDTSGIPWGDTTELVVRAADRDAALRMAPKNFHPCTWKAEEIPSDGEEEVIICTTIEG